MKYHLIGIEGISMRGLAKYLETLGHIVSGSDLKREGHKKENITEDIDCVVRTSAVNPGSPGWVEVLEAKKLGIKVLKRSELIGELTKNKKLIAISGMHGKTTVTSMAGLVLIAAGYDPTVLVGERLKEFDGETVKIGKSDLFVLEACEYDRSFLDFYPKIVILTNLDNEHPDTFPGGMEEIKETFLEYLSHIPKNGLIIACCEDKNIVEIIDRLESKPKIIFYGKGSQAYNKIDFELGVPGYHNELNALSVIALADYLNVDQRLTKNILSVFRGAKRRFEKLGTYKGADIIDDYGHHPTEIKSTIEALKDRYGSFKKIVVFWPHQYKRVKNLLEEFSESFDFADEVIIKPIFLVPGRDEKLNVSSNDLVKLIRQRNKNVLFKKTDEEILSHLRSKLDDKSVLLTIGIPPVYEIGQKLLKEKTS